MQVKIPFFFTSFCSFLLCLSIVQAQTWQSLNGPLESDISKIIVRGDSIYVASIELGGFFKRHKDDNYWTYMDVAIPDGSQKAEIVGLNSIEIVPSGTYYVSGSGLTINGNYFNHFYKSDDFGKSWQISANGIDYFEGPIVEENDIIMTSKGSLITGFGDGIFTYSEEEEAFIQSSENGGIINNRVFTFYEYRDTLFAGRINGFEYSIDDGLSWISSSFDSLKVFSFAYKDEMLFAGTNKGLYKASSVNGTFELVDELLDLTINALHFYQNLLLAGTDSGAFLINPENLDPQPLFQTTNFTSIKTINSIENAVLFGTENGFYECSTEEENCKLAGVANSRVQTMNFQRSDTLWVGTIENIHRYFLNTDQWDTLNIPIGRARNIIPVSRDSFYVVNDSYFQRCSFSSSDCDSLQIDSGNPLFDLKQNTAGDLFIASRKRVYKSSDQGGNWEVIYTNPENVNFSLFTHSDSLLFINGGELIKYSLVTDSYKILNNGVSIITNDGTIYSAVNGIQKSTDFGETWITILPGSKTLDDRLGGIKFVLFDEESKILYAITTAGGVYVTENGGLDWGVNDELYHTYIESATIGTDGTLYLGTGKAGIFVNTKPLSPPITISNEENINMQPRNFRILPNYPNPFNPSTTISFELNAIQKVNLNVFDILGQKITSLDLGLKQSGMHKFKLDLSNYSSGIYIVRIKAGEEIRSQKITLIK